MSEKPFVLYREDALRETRELDAIERFLPSSAEMDSIPAGSVVFPRFRSIPFGEQLEAAVLSSGSRLVNSWAQYGYVSNIFEWVDDLAGLTPAAYRVSDIRRLPKGEYFIKGQTNSHKHDWKGSAFAPTIDAVLPIVEKLRANPVIADQEIVIRPFTRFRQLAVQDSGQPVFNEWRVFVLNGQVMAKGFYWSKQSHIFAETETLPLKPLLFDETLYAVIERIGGKIPFVVIDLAEMQDGTWKVIELNEASMSGLTGASAVKLWEGVALYYSEGT